MQSHRVVAYVERVPLPAKSSGTRAQQAADMAFNRAVGSALFDVFIAWDKRGPMLIPSGIAPWHPPDAPATLYVMAPYPFGYIADYPALREFHAIPNKSCIKCNVGSDNLDKVPGEPGCEAAALRDIKESMAFFRARYTSYQILCAAEASVRTTDAALAAARGVGATAGIAAAEKERDAQQSALRIATAADAAAEKKGAELRLAERIVPQYFWALRDPVNATPRLGFLTILPNGSLAA